MKMLRPFTTRWFGRNWQSKWMLDLMSMQMGFIPTMSLQTLGGGLIAVRERECKIMDQVIFIVSSACKTADRR